MPNSSLLNIAEHENFSANKYENANFWKKFYNLRARKSFLFGTYTGVNLQTFVTI